MEGLACFDEASDYSSGKCILTGRCNLASQAFAEEPHQGFSFLPSGREIELQPMSLPHVVKGEIQRIGFPADNKAEKGAEG